MLRLSLTLVGTSSCALKQVIVIQVNNFYSSPKYTKRSRIIKFKFRKTWNQQKVFLLLFDKNENWLGRFYHRTKHTNFTQIYTLVPFYCSAVEPYLQFLRLIRNPPCLCLLAFNQIFRYDDSYVLCLLNIFLLLKHWYQNFFDSLKTSRHITLLLLQSHTLELY